MTTSVHHADLLSILTLIDACCSEIEDPEISIGDLSEAPNSIKAQAARLALLVQRKRIDLKNIADFPVSHRDNMDAHNMAKLAIDAYLAETL